jgi:uncharacterized OsmC-like protein
VRESFRNHSRARVRVAYGTACEVEHDDRTIRVDQPPAEGGSSTGPHPAQLLRASLGASVLAAVRRGCAVDDVSVEITSESSAESPLLWSRLWLLVEVASGGPSEEVAQAVTRAVEASTMLALLHPLVERAIRVRVVPRTR